MNAPRHPVALHRELDRVWRRGPGLRGWLADVNHSALGVRFMVTAMVFFAIGGVLAMLIRAQLANPRSAFIGPEIYSQVFTMHGSVMMFLFAIPMLEGLAIYLLPKLLGARDMAFPRLTAMGYWCYLFGGMILLAAMAVGVAPDSGWFMYTPLSDRTHTPGIHADVWLLGITFVEISAICAAVEIMVSILKLRADGMPLMKMPILGWYLLGTAAMMLVGFPPLILGSILLEVQRAFDWPFFDVARGGDPVLWQHLFWLFGHPEVYIIFLPAAGVLSTLIPVFARARLLSYGMVVAAVLATVFLSFGLWVHHMFAVGIPHLALAFFSAASALVAVPTAVQVFIWIGTLWQGRPRWSLPMLYVAGFFLTFVFGGLTGVMLASVPFNWQAHDTAFVTAHLHYVLVGGFYFPVLAGIYYWLPMITGRSADTGLGKAAFWLTLVGFHLTFLIMHWTGLLGMPRRISTYAAHGEWAPYNLVSSVGGFVMAFGVALFVVDVIVQARLGTRGRRNPWRSGSLEWAMPTPPPPYNIVSLPRWDPQASHGVLAPARIDSLGAELAGGHGLLPGAPRGLRETLQVDALGGRSEAVAVLPGNTLLPLLTSLCIGAFFLAMLASLYWLTVPILVLIAIVLLQWPRGLGDARAGERIAVSDGLELPTSNIHPRGLGWWGSRMTLVANATLFASLLFAAGYLAAIAPNWTALDASRIAARPGAWALGVSAIGAMLLHFNAMRAGTLHALALVLAAGGIVGYLWIEPMAADRHALFAVRHMMAAYLLSQLLIVSMMRIAPLLKPWPGHDGPAEASRAGVIADWSRYTAVATLLGVAVIAWSLW